LNWKKQLVNYSWLFGIAILIVLLDQITKAWIRNHLSYAEIYRPDLWLSQYARIMHWGNTGGAIGVLQGKGFIFTGLSFVICAAILYFFPQIPPEERLLQFALAMQLGGALGNLVDRLTRGYVTDFISIGAFPVLNIADISLSTGVIILILGLWLRERRLKQPTEAIQD
jgi:signal peptidase II